MQMLAATCHGVWTRNSPPPEEHPPYPAGGIAMAPLLLLASSTMRARERSGDRDTTERSSQVGLGKLSTELR
jgi:hypothetical protein